MPTFRFTARELIAIAKTSPDESACLWYSPQVNASGRVETVILCQACNWDTERLYVLAENYDLAVGLLKSGNDGLCGWCYADMLTDTERRQARPLLES